MKLKIKYILFFCLTIFYSCSTSASIKKSSNSFLAYYNTFYSAEKSFNDALKIISENQLENDEIPSSAISLLEQAISNSLIIEEQFYNTKYLGQYSNYENLFLIHEIQIYLYLCNMVYI